MKWFQWIILVQSAWLASASAQTLAVSDFENGTITASPTVSGGVYRVQWSSSLNPATWHSPVAWPPGPFEPFVAGSNSVSVDVPVFYRVQHLNMTAKVHGIHYEGATPQPGVPMSISLSRPSTNASFSLFQATTTGSFGEYCFTNVPYGEIWLLAGTQDEDYGFFDTDSRLTVATPDLRRDLISPGRISGFAPADGTVLADTTPLLTWTAPLPYVEYSVSLLDGDWNQFAHGTTDIPEFQITTPLPTGVSYRVSIFANIPGYSGGLSPFILDSSFSTSD